MTGNQRKILVVDDDADFIETATVALEAKGYEVLTALDSKAGVELARRERPDLIICDLMMERLYSGFSVVQELGGYEETRGIPVIMVSAVTTDTGFRIDEQGEKPAWLRAVQFINKPINPLDLAEKVESILSGSSEDDD